jgi:hypothetical protein
MMDLTELITKFPSAQSAANRQRRTARFAGAMRGKPIRAGATRPVSVRDTARRRNEAGLFPLQAVST